MTVATFDPNAAIITATDAALKHFAKSLENQDKHFVRLATETNGCSGYGYVLDLVAEAKDNDVLVVLGNNIELAIASDAVDILRGTEIDMVTEGLNRVIKFNNPNVVAECGCGESFSIS